jgi:hypothetical protein
MNEVNRLGDQIPGFIAAVKRHMREELAAEPHAHLGPMAASTMVRPYYLTVGAADSLTVEVHLTFFVDLHEKQQFLEVVQYRIDAEPDPW